jgi:ribosomal protein S12 methylthiotransferase accessory factor
MIALEGNTTIKHCGEVGKCASHCYDALMLSDTIPFDSFWKKMHGVSRSASSVAAFVRFIERRLGARFMYESSRIPYTRPDLMDVFKVADKLQRANIIESYSPVFGFYDEPRARLWQAQGLGRSREVSGGMSAESDEDALMAALAEGLERYIWTEEIDYFKSPRIATVVAMAQDKSAILPDRFAGFTKEQRANDPQLMLTPDDEYLWIRGRSLTHGRDVYLPAQAIAGAQARSPLSHGKKEQIIRTPITTGLATWPTKDGAVLAGALEVIERDAYMITWLNQLTLPRIDLALWREKNDALDKLMMDCERYRLRVHALCLPTDAPADVVCVVIEDITGHAPRFSLGLKAHRDIGRCIEGALLEALRSRQNARRYGQEQVEELQKKKPSEIRHMERLVYWMSEERAKRLSFLIKGPIESTAPSPWTHDTPREHLERIRQWCVESKYEFISVSLGISKKNPLPWHIEMVVLPELQPMHQNEQFPCLGGERLKSIPEKFGYKARTKPFADEPHPFA